VKYLPTTKKNIRFARLEHNQHLLKSRIEEKGHKKSSHATVPQNGLPFQ
jgi:retron-type reverse transcriptase